MQVQKLAPMYNAQDLAVYLLNRAVDLGFSAANKSVTPLKRGYDNLLKAFDGDRCLLVLVTDSLLESGYAKDVGVGSRLVTVGTFDVEVSKLGGTDQPWKYLYYKRLTQTWPEREYMTYWIGVLTDADEAPMNTPPPAGLATWYDVAEEARKMLDIAVRAINRRMKEQGMLDDRPDIGPAPRVGDSAFVRNINRLKWGHASTS